MAQNYRYLVRRANTPALMVLTVDKMSANQPTYTYTYAYPTAFTQDLTKLGHFQIRHGILLMNFKFYFRFLQRFQSISVESYTQAVLIASTSHAQHLGGLNMTHARNKNAHAGIHTRNKHSAISGIPSNS